MTEPVLDVRSLNVAFETLRGKFYALNGVDLTIKPGEVVGLVGESGCGKSTLALAVMGLLPSPPAKVLGGEILFQGKEDLLKLKEKEMERIRGTGISMIFQEPLTCLNPLFTVGNQLSEAIRTRRQRDDKITANSKGTVGVSEEAANWIPRVGLSDPKTLLDRYPHELSGGMRQRVMIAMALAEQTALMLADEPTSALDVTIQAQILKLIYSLVNEINTSVLFIGHDLAVVAQVAGRVCVMYAGIIVEEARVLDLFEEPLHPYTKALLKSIPTGGVRKRHLEIIPGSVPTLTEMLTACPFYNRCKYAREICLEGIPKLKEVPSDHKVACVLY